MKKYLFAALALTALVACNKDPVDEVLTSSKKSVVISIANMASGTRAEGTATSMGPQTEEACTTIDGNFYIFFLDSSKNIIKRFVGTDLATYGANNNWTFNGLSEEVTMVVAAGNLTSNVPKEEETLDVTSWNLTENSTVIVNEQQEVNIVAAPYENLKGQVVYDVSNLTETDETLGDMKVYTAELEIAPQMARIEITQISCTDFGTEVEVTYLEDNEKSLGFSIIGIESMVLAGGEAITTMSAGTDYTITLSGDIANDTALNSATYTIIPDDDETQTESENVLKPEEDGKVWSWNIAPQEVSNLVTHLYVKGNDYTAIVPKRTVTISSYTKTSDSSNINSFEKGNIYRFAIDFSHKNLDNTDSQYIVANVTVSIANWVVNKVTPGFATGNN